MRLIDADLLLANARIFLDRAEMDAAYSESREVKADWDDAMRLIREAPTVDAVPVVRCEDCIYYDCIYTFKVGNCVYKHRNWPVSNEEFCSKGESKSK